jgi:hypothetical protein
MKIWTDYLLDSKYLDSIFQEEKPCLSKVDIHGIVFHRDGPKISIRMNLNEYPAIPPRKWVLQRFNTVQLTLALIDIKDVTMSGWVDSSYIADVTIGEINGDISICVSGGNLKLAVRASFIDIDGVSAYMKNSGC